MKTTIAFKRIMTRFVLSAITILFAFVACSTEDKYSSGTDDGGVAYLGPSVTIDASHISAISAVLAGKANLGGSVAADLRVGFQYSKSAGILPSNSTTIDAEDTDINYNYSSSVTGLEPGTTYYFRSFVRQNGTDVYGETKQFKTKELESLIQTKDATGVEASEATLNAMLDLTDVLFTDIEYGFYWGLPEEELNTRLDGGQIDGHAFSTPMTSLQHNTQYWYKAYVKLDNQTFYGKVMNFTTDVIPVESVSLDNDEYAIHTIGSSVVLQATIQPSDATDKRVSWTSSNESVATVDENGKVTAIDNGTTTVTVTTIDQKKTTSCEIKVAQWITEISLDNDELTLNDGDEYSLTASIAPKNAANQTLVWTSSDQKVASVDANGLIHAVSLGKAVILVSARDGSEIQAKCSVVVESVDLGLSVKWRGWNLGASKPEEYGDYYAWGETNPKSYYDWNSYWWCNGSSYSSLKKYNTKSSYGTVDNKTQLEPNDDAAHVLLGSAWRIPTVTEWFELLDSCTWTWISDYNGSGVAGYFITSKVKGFTDKSTFLPAAGFWEYGGRSQVSSRCEYWSSSLYEPNPRYANGMSFNSVSGSFGVRDRFFGLTIRPVSDL